jgi:hypothetical protein
VEVDGDETLAAVSEGGWRKIFSVEDSRRADLMWRWRWRRRRPPHQELRAGSLIGRGEGREARGIDCGGDGAIGDRGRSTRIWNLGSE